MPLDPEQDATVAGLLRLQAVISGRLWRTLMPVPVGSIAGLPPRTIVMAPDDTVWHRRVGGWDRIAAAPLLEGEVESLHAYWYTSSDVEALTEHPGRRFRVLGLSPAES